MMKFMKYVKRGISCFIENIFRKIQKFRWDIDGMVDKKV